MAADDPYVYPHTNVLRNKLGLRDAAALSLAQDDLVAARYAGLMVRLPKPTFTFETLTDIHYTLFQDVFDWAGYPRTNRIGKADFEGPGSTITWFADPKQIRSIGRLIFKLVGDEQNFVGLDRAGFSWKAGILLNDLNMLHAFREGNGRTQRLLLASVAEHAGHSVAFDVVTRERMVATSIAAGNGDKSGFVRLFEEITDPRRVEALRKALVAMKKARSLHGTTSTLPPLKPVKPTMAYWPAGQGTTS